jgi:FAD/FMN-containing dehydrogenase
MTRSALAPPPHFRGRFLVDGPALDAHAAASGVLRARPAAVAIPAHVEDVVALVRWAAAEGIGLVPRGAGTGMPGGNVGPGVSIDMVSEMRVVEPLEPGSSIIRVEPGATHAELNAACLPLGLHLPVDPSSGRRCTIGGMIANNSAGAHSVKYGAMRSWVHSLDLVLANGTTATVVRGRRPASHALGAILDQLEATLLPERERIVRDWPRVRKNSSGYSIKEYLETGDAVDLIVGSEGTLAMIVGAEIRLAPIAPARGVALVEHASLDAVGETIQRLLPLAPATCELLDRTFLQMVRDGGYQADFPLGSDPEALLLVEMEGGSIVEVEQQLDAVRAAAIDAERVSIAVDPERQLRFWDIRRAASPLIASRADGRVSMQFIEDGVVPVDRLADYIRLLRDVLSRHDLPAVIFGHAGDGNLHVNPLVDTAAPRWRIVLESVLHEVAEGVARLGGTLAGEHGDGRLRAPLLETIWGPEMVRRFRAVKQAFDPEGILNPGVILPLPDQRPLEGIIEGGESLRP